MNKVSAFVYNIAAPNVKQPSRRLSMKDLSKWYREQFYPSGKNPPYGHICQIGDPVLRRPCQAVDIELIQHPQIQAIIKKMWDTLDRYECSSLSAPQIGVPLQISVMKSLPRKSQKDASFVHMPIKPKVIINPKMKVLDYNSKVQAPEGCVSVRSFAAEVIRYTTIEVQAYNERGEKEQWSATGFEARVLQHELDHLEGILFTDKMIPKTLECSAWQEVNYHCGKLAIPYGPRKRSTVRSILESLKL